MNICDRNQNVVAKIDFIFQKKKKNYSQYTQPSINHIEHYSIDMVSIDW